MKVFRIKMYDIPIQKISWEYYFGRDTRLLLFLLVN